MWLKVPGFIKLSVVTAFNNARIQVKVNYILFCSSITQKDTSEVVMVQFTLSVARAFYANP